MGRSLKYFTPDKLKLSTTKPVIIYLLCAINQKPVIFRHMNITLESIGTIHTPFKEKEGMPIQSAAAQGVRGHIILNEKFTAGLTDLEGFSHIILLYYFHMSAGFDLQIIPFLDNTQHGVFATRAPRRPNPIGISVVKLMSIQNNILNIENTDMLDGTPLLDIKPYIKDFDVHEIQRSGWLEDNANKLKKIKSDKRFN
jgi:tRNA-Thr(GGU) m(6)t(6)A37 methyltransferase TsaA